MDVIETFLVHHGIKGMKWGIRHDPKTGNVESGSHPRAKDLSNEDLQNAIRRMELEQRYNNLLNPDKARTRNAGRQFVSRIAQELASTAIKAVGNHFINQALENTIKRNKKQD